MLITRLNGSRHLLMNWRAWLIAIATSGGIVASMLYFMDWAPSAHHFEAISWRWLLIAYAFLWINQILSSLRLLFASSVPTTSENWRSSLNINVIQQVSSRFMPLRLSEVLWVYLVMKKFDWPAGKTLGLLMHMRVWDFGVILLIGIVMLPTAYAEGYYSDMKVVIPAAGIGVLAVCVLKSRYCFQLLRNYSRWMTFYSYARIFRLRALGMVRSVRVSARHKPVKQLILAIACWSSTFMCLLSILEAVGLSSSLQKNLLSLVIMLLASAVPIPAMGIVGGGEAGFAATLFAMGIELAEAARVALLLGVIHSVLSLMVGGLWISAALVTRTLKLELMRKGS